MRGLRMKKKKDLSGKKNKRQTADGKERDH